MLVLYAVVLLVAEAKLRGRSAYHRLGSGAARVARPMPLGKWRIPSLIYCTSVALLALGIPIATLTYWLVTGTSGGEDLSELPGATFNSALLGSLSALAVTLAALPIALLAVRFPSRLTSFLERYTYLGHALAGIVIALAFVFLGARYLTPIYQTLLLLILAMVVRYVPEAVGSIRSSLLQISPRLEEASRTLGTSSFMTTVRVTMPLAAPGISAGATLVFLTVMKELPITLLLSPTGFNTLATEVWSSTGSGAYGRAAAPAMLLILLSALPTILLSVRPPRQHAPAKD
jgi:iron(III) transport system permease protein